MPVPDESSLLLSARSLDEKQRLFADVFTRHRERLHLMVRLRLDHRVCQRMDPSDVLQEAYLEASRRLDEYLRDPPMPLFLWLRRITGQKLLEMSRFHLGMQKRAVGREIPMDREILGHTTSRAFAAELVSRAPSPGNAAAQAELRAWLEKALDKMSSRDREIIALRHFEQLSSVEAAQVLGLSEPTARQRYLRAMTRLRDILADMPGGLEAL